MSWLRKLLPSWLRKLLLPKEKIGVGDNMIVVFKKGGSDEL